MLPGFKNTLALPLDRGKRVIRRELARQHRGWRTPSGGSPDTTLALSRDYETSNSPDPQDGRAEVSCPDFKRAESAESAESAEKHIRKKLLL